MTLTAAKEKYEFITYDQRVLERNLRRHRITQVEYQKYLKNLPDEKEHGEEVSPPKEFVKADE